MCEAEGGENYPQGRGGGGGVLSGDTLMCNDHPSKAVVPSPKQRMFAVMLSEGPTRNETYLLELFFVL